MVRGLIIGIGILVLISILGRVYLVSEAHKNGKEMYEIEVFDYNHSSRSYFVEEYAFDKNGCISFKDEWGNSKIVCGQVNITKY